MRTILKTAAAFFLTLSVGMSVFAAGSKVEIKTDEVKKFDEALRQVGLNDVRLTGLDRLVGSRKELKSSFNEVTKSISANPDFFKNNRDTISKLINHINGATGMAADVYDRIDSGALTFPNDATKAKAAQVLKAAEALPGILSTISAKNGDIARADRVSSILSQISRDNIVASGTPDAPIGTEAKPMNVDDIIFFLNKALSENRTDGKKYTIDDLIKSCLDALRKA